MTINAIIAIGRAWFLLHPEIPIQIGDISRRGGGAFPPHASHSKGKDFDVRPLRKDDRMDPVTIGDAAYDTMRSEEAIQLVLGRHPGATVFFNDQRLIKKGLTKHAAGHHNHFHVRFP
jgi:murein endopeptidase